jgi:peptidoglycan/xylan/chitin deacetylase (PgdA/CDA1 family)
MKKKIIITWDLDGFVGVLNSTMPYNYDSTYVYRELEYVQKALQLLEKYGIKTAFAITGFSAEEGQYPCTFPNLIQEIDSKGHEVASHSWRHEWIPLFTAKQVERSLLRSKSALEKRLKGNTKCSGFVPPHNKPATWFSKGAFSLGDRGIYPFFEMGDLSKLFKLLKKTGYSWVRISHQPIWRKFKKRELTLPQKVYKHDGLLILQNHYCGFDQGIIDYIENNQQEYFIISAHPVMLSFDDKRPECWENFEKFILHFAHRQDVEFIRPMDII